MKLVYTLNYSDSVKVAWMSICTFSSLGIDSFLTEP